MPSKSSVKTILFSIFFMLNACGEPETTQENNPKSDDAFTAQGSVHKMTGTTKTLTFEDGEAGAQYFVMPYALGSTSSVNGGSSSDNIIFSIKSQSASLSLIEPSTPMESSFYQDVMTERAFDYALRFLLNRFNPKNPESWQLARHLEQVTVTDGPYQNFWLAGGSKNIVKGLKNLTKNMAQSKKQQKNPQFLNANCPSSDNLASFGDDMDSDEVVLQEDSTSYCLYVHYENGLISETKLATIKTSIETTLSNYKKIYSDSFSNTNGAYKFQPLVIVIPYGDDSYWPTSTGPKVSAAFVESTSVTHARPTLYVAADQSKVGSETNKTKLNELFHSSIAHEMQHAILHYYRYTQNLSLDEPQFDEGIAHFMEDLMGYGEVNFSAYPGSFLNAFAVGLNSAFPSFSGTGTEIQRGAAHVLFYYLVSQKGGVSFTDGLPDAGGGLDFIKSFVQGASTNMQGLSAAYGSDWHTTIGNFFGALAVDGSFTVIEGDKYKVQSPKAGIKNTIGSDGKTYGMRYHRHGGVADLSQQLENFDKASSTEQDLELLYYHTKPILVTLNDTTDTINVTINAAFENAGMSVIRFK